MFEVRPAIAQTSFDPLSIAVGARALGMGKACVAVAEEGDTIFTNPAGLGEIDSFQFASMSANILDGVNYTVLGGVYALGGKGALGVGYASANVGGIEVRDANGTLTNRANFGSSVLFASYGKKLTEDFSVGLNLKYYSQDGSEVNDGDGSGYNLDIGFLQKGLGWLSLGAVGSNLLSSSKVRYANGEEEALPLTVRLGARMYLLGEKFESAISSPVELSIATDADLSLQASKPTTAHIGLELSPVRYLTIRTGLDQDPTPGGVQNNFTAGLTLRVAGIGFHYAYHPYSGSDQNITHYFSISFNERGWAPEELPDTFISKK